VEPVCAVLEVSPSAYYAAKKREENPSARDERDEEMKKEIMRVWSGKGRKAYGARKVWRELGREGIDMAKCTVERLMAGVGYASCRTGARCVGNGNLVLWRPDRQRPGPSFRSWSSVHIYCLYRAARGDRCRAFGREEG
jgi:hypothetical protein